MPEVTQHEEFTVTNKIEKKPLDICFRIFLIFKMVLTLMAIVDKVMALEIW